MTRRDNGYGVEVRCCNTNDSTGKILIKNLIVTEAGNVVWGLHIEFRDPIKFVRI